MALATMELNIDDVRSIAFDVLTQSDASGIFYRTITIETATTTIEITVSATDEQQLKVIS